MIQEDLKDYSDVEIVYGFHKLSNFEPSYAAFRDELFARLAAGREALEKQKELELI